KFDKLLFFYLFIWVGNFSYKEKPIYLKSALDSVLNQTLPPSEIILIKDGPLTVELEKVLSSYDTNLLKIIPLPNNLGLSKALNIGLKHCSYEFVARMDTDDICYPSRFEKQVLFFAITSYDRYCGGLCD
ncbi:glycosyltransferase, partial [Bacteroides uniformis]|uniref:glycosyltransferase n=1 Tax=Bacteroides uniformis TaxID=820 RepID=UPI001F000825